eukprot:366000-Chlamydomonas_euryale.AAC.57
MPRHVGCVGRQAHAGKPCRGFWTGSRVAGVFEAGRVGGCSAPQMHQNDAPRAGAHLCWRGRRVQT